MDARLEAVLRDAVERRCRPDIDDIDAQNILFAIEKLRAKLTATQNALAQMERQNRSLKEALIGWRQRAWPGIDQRAVVEKDYPVIGEQHGKD